LTWSGRHIQNDEIGSFLTRLSTAIPNIPGRPPDTPSHQA
jgi:hypothetical protein